MKTIDNYTDGRWSPSDALLPDTEGCYSSPRLGRRRSGYFLALILLLCAPMSAQHARPSPSPPTVTPGVPTDALGRTTPRDTVLNFLSAGAKGANDVAAEYLNTQQRGPAAATLAHQLFVVLDRRLPAKLNELSDQPEGSRSNLRPTQELVGTISSANGDVDITLERVDRGKAGSLWLFSKKTLASIPDLFDEIDVVAVENVLPQFLMNIRIARIPLYHWLAVFVGMPLFYLLTTLLSRLLSAAVGLFLRRVYRDPTRQSPQLLPNPIRLLLLALVIRWLLSNVGLPLLARQFWSSVAALITTASVVWLLIALNGGAESYIHRRLELHHKAGANTVLRLARRTVDLLIVFGGVLQILLHFGVNPTAALGALGLGGIAVALAAQKTLENVIGGVSLIFDQAVRVGDSAKVGDTVGVIDAIGLRSMRIRTVDRTVVSVPNGQAAVLSLENLSARDKFWFHPTFGLRYGITSPQMHAVLKGIDNLLDQSPVIESGSSRVRLLRFGPSSLEVEAFAYVFARDWNHFLELQQNLLLRIMECVESAGVRIAVPSQTVFLTSAASSGDEGARALLKTAAPDKKGDDKAA
jgi:MscS family membrane protein